MTTKTNFLLAAMLLSASLNATAQTARGSTFTKITTGAIVTDGGSSPGCAWGDYDNDGYVDLFVGNAWGQTSFLYHNSGDGTFTKVTAGPVVETPGDNGSVIWGDYDNDGWLDLYVVNWYTATATDVLYRNLGGGEFVRVQNGVMGIDNAQGFGAAWADYDRDGWLDLFVGNSLQQRSRLFHGTGEGNFERIESAPMGTFRSTATGCAWGDYDNDGDPDLVVCALIEGTTWPGPPQNDFLFQNEGGSDFIQITSGPMVTDNARSLAPAWADFDNDGDLDLFVVNGERENDRLYRNDGQGVFTLLAENVVCNDGQRGAGCAWGDYDNDGWLDLFVTGRFKSTIEAGATNRLYRNRGGGEFEHITTGKIATEGPGSLGCAWADYDNDGFLDLFVANTGDTEPDLTNIPMDNFLYHNQGNSNRWLLVKLAGTVSNRSAIGAKVRVQATIGGQTFWQLREISGGSGHCSQNDLRAHFGLGDATNATIVRIEWPSGTVQALRNVAANQILTVTERPVLLADRDDFGEFRLNLKGGRGRHYAVDYSTNLTHWTELTDFTPTDIITPVADPGTSSVSSRFYRAREVE
jgi:hypothetical protein